MTGARDLKLEIDYRHEESGWIDCFLTFDGVRHNILASDVYPPFPQLLHWMRALIANRLPHRFYWDEEGVGVMIESWPVAEDSPNFRLRIQYRSFNGVGGDVWADAELDRQAVVDMLLAALRDFAQHARRPSGGPWYCSLKDIRAFELFRQRVIPPRGDIHSCEPILFRLSCYRQHQNASLWLHFELWGITALTLALSDNHPMWPLWFAWLEKILLGELPAEVDFLDLDKEQLNRKLVAIGELPESALENHWGNSFRALPVDHPRHFRLVVTEADDDFRDFLQLDEVQDRRAFVAAFCAEFERMLAEEYKLLPGDDGVICDLRHLPLARLQALLAEEIE